MQNFIVPWSIAIHCLSFAKPMQLKHMKEMLIAIIDEQQLMPGFPDCLAEEKKHSVAFSDFAKRVKNAAGMTHVVCCRQTTSFNEFLNRGRHSASGKWVVCCTYIWWSFYSDYYALSLSNSIPARVQNDTWASTVFRSGMPLSNCLRIQFPKDTRQEERSCTASWAAT